MSVMGHSKLSFPESTQMVRLVFVKLEQGEVPLGHF